MSREPFKMMEVGSRPEPRRIPWRLYGLVFTVAIAFVVLVSVLVAIRVK